MADLNLGFVPLTDAAPLIVAAEKGFFRDLGLEVTLVREQAWASVRDKLVHGLLDAAQALAPMPLAMTLGLDQPAVAMRAPLVLSLNGNGITVAPAVHAALVAADAATAPQALSARGLRPLAAARRRAGERALTFAVVFPWSCHRYQLRRWLAQGGVDPDRDVEITVVPPPRVADALAAGHIDGFCAGEPWNRRAVRDGAGRLATTGFELRADAMEKVLALRADRADGDEPALTLLLRGLLRAGAWLADLENRLEAAHILARDDYLAQPAGMIAPSLLGLVADGAHATPRHVPRMHVFADARHAWPRRAEVETLLAAMGEAGDIAAAPQDLAAGVFDPATLRGALRAEGLDPPRDDG